MQRAPKGRPGGPRCPAIGTPTAPESVCSSLRLFAGRGASQRWSTSKPACDLAVDAAPDLSSRRRRPEFGMLGIREIRAHDRDLQILRSVPAEASVERNVSGDALIRKSIHVTDPGVELDAPGQIEAGLEEGRMARGVTLLPDLRRIGTPRPAAQAQVKKGVTGIQPPPGNGLIAGLELHAVALSFETVRKGQRRTALQADQVLVDVVESRRGRRERGRRLNLVPRLESVDSPRFDGRATRQKVRRL